MDVKSVKSLLRVVRTEIYYTAVLFKIGGLKVFWKQLKRQIYSRSSQIGLELDLQKTNIPHVEAKVKYTLQLASEEDMNEVLRKAKAENKGSVHSLVYRRWLYQDGYHNFYIARTTDTNDLCFMQSVIYQRDNTVVDGRFKGWFPKPEKGEAILEGAYTYERYRGQGLGSAVPTDIMRICKNNGIKRVITYIEKSNAASLRAAEKDGFVRFEEVPELRILFSTRRKYHALEDSSTTEGRAEDSGQTIIKRAFRMVRYAALQLRLGGYKALFPQLKRQVYRRTVSVGFNLDLQESDIPQVEAKIRYTLRLATKDDMDEALQKASSGNKGSARDLVYRRWLYEDGYHNCYIARTADTNDLCFMQFTMYPDDDKVVEGRFKGWFPKLKEDEVLIEGAYTFEKYRGQGLYPSVTAEQLRICREKGFKRVVAHIEKDNVASIKGIEKVGFTPFEEVSTLRVFFFTRRKHRVGRTKEGTTATASAQERQPAIPIHRNGKIGAIVVGGHFQGLGLLRSLARQHVPTYLLYGGICIARFSKYVKRYAKYPDLKREDHFFEFLTDLARRENLEGWLIYPNDDEMVYFLAKYRERLEQYYRVTTPSWDIVKFAYDKMLTYKLAEQCHIDIPKTYYPRNAEELEQLDIEFPVIIKPSVKEPFFSRTRRKAIRVDNRRDLVDEYTKAATLVGPSQTVMVQELIPDGARNLFSVGSFFKDGELLGKVVARRLRQHPMDFGHATTYAETVDIPELEEIATKILREIGYYGLSEVEFMRDQRDGKYKLLEINARPWGWHTIAIGAGVDLPYLSYRDMLGEKVEQNGFVKGVKWFRLVTDTPIVVIELLKGRMKLTEYLNSFKGQKEFAVMSLKDPMPFIVELAMLPQLFWQKKGFW